MKKFFILSILACFFVYSLTSCNVTRTVTTLASSYKSGDTTTTVITKTVESYDAKKYENR